MSWFSACHRMVWVAQSRCPSLISFGWASCLFLDSFTHMHFLALGPSLVQTRLFLCPREKGSFCLVGQYLAEMASCCCCRPADRADPARLWDGFSPAPSGSLCLEYASQILHCFCVSIVMEWIFHLPTGLFPSWGNRALPLVFSF